MPHSSQPPWKCPYCGTQLSANQNRRELVCPAHRDLPALEPLDDRYTLQEDGKP